MSLSQKKVTVNGIEYTLQKIGLEDYLSLVDRTTKGTDQNRVEWARAMFEHVVISPKVTYEDFEDDIMSGLELVNQCDSFLLERQEPQKKQKKKSAENGPNGA